MSEMKPDPVWRIRFSHVWRIRHEARLDQLRELLQLAEAGILLDAAAIRELIAEVEAATTPIEDFA